MMGSLTLQWVVGRVGQFPVFISRKVLPQCTLALESLKPQHCGCYLPNAGRWVGAAPGHVHTRGGEVMRTSPLEPLTQHPGHVEYQIN